MDKIFAFFISSIIPILLLFFIIKDGKNKRLLAFFMWGIVSYILALPVNEFFFSLTGLGVHDLSISTGPMVEEFFKMLPLFYIFIFYTSFRQEIVSLGMASGIGFAIQENIQYILVSPETGRSLVVYITLRSLSTCLMHGLATAMVAYGIFLMSRSGKRVHQVFFGFFALAVIFHALFNLLVNSPYYPIGAILPILVYLAVNVFILPEKESV